MLFRFIFIFIASFTFAFSEEVNFNFEIKPILSDKCYFCHGPDAENQKGDLRLDKAKTAHKVFKPHDLKNSEAWSRILSKDPDEVMPPPESNLTLTNKEKDLLKRWVEQGAKYEKHWAYISLPKKIDVPKVKNNSSTNAIDAFILNKLPKGLKQNELADPAVLARRASLILTGLPLKADLKEEFLKDPSEKAYAKLVDKLLKSESCAENLAVHWMDNSRFADSYGFQVDRTRDMTAWRDWVIQAFNHNMGYDKFITWQLAGDLIENPTRDSILATAFNRHHQQKSEGGSVDEEFRVEYVADRTHTAGTVMLGLTFECARCHDHKYDDISAKDYYRFFSFFNNIDESGLYSFFTPSAPTPALSLGTDAQVAQKKVLSASFQTKADELNLLESTLDKEYQQFISSKASVALPEALAYYSFDDLKGGFKNTISDNYHAKGAAKLVEGAKGKGIQLSGDDEIKLGTVGPYDRAKPFSVKLNLRVEQSYDRAVVFHRSRAWSDAASRGYELLIEGGKLSWALINFWPGNAIRVKSKSVFPLHSWENVTVTYDGSSKASGLKIFVNGAEQEVEVIKDHLTRKIYYNRNDKKGMPVIIGARFRDRGLKNGQVDEFYVYDKELFSSEVKALVKETKFEGIEKDVYLSRVNKQYIAKKEELKELRIKFNTLLDQEKEIMVMKELEETRKTYVLKRGLYSDPDPDQQVYPAGPQAVLPYTNSYAQNRLGLAKWLTDRKNPLTSRVVINRIWSIVFNQGIVSTLDDFGNQGTLPTHPKLLDWLSVEFMNSGWDIKHMLKWMVTSHAFKQASYASAEKLALDPSNLYYSFGPRRRLSAEMIRDQALFVSGQLSSRIGGGSENAETSKRRALYLQWKRNSPPPSMMIFDAPTRQLCTVKRETTSTPLQALVLLNRELYVDASKKLAENLVKKYKDEKQVMKELFSTLTGRVPDEKESEVLWGAYQDQLNLFKENEPRLAAFVNKKKFPTIKESRSWAAWSIISNMVMNLDDTITIR